MSLGKSTNSATLPADAQNELTEQLIQPTRRRGPKGLPAAERLYRAQISLSGRDWEYVRKFGPRPDNLSADKADTLAVECLIEVMRRYRPSGPSSGGGNTHAAKLRPGTVTSLKKELSERDKRIAALEEELRKARGEEAQKTA